MPACTDKFVESEVCCNDDDSLSETGVQPGAEDTVINVTENTNDKKRDNDPKHELNDDKTDVLSDVSDLDWTNDWREPDSREFSQRTDESKQGKESDDINESFDQKELDDSLALADHADSDQNCLALELGSDDGQWGALKGTFLEINKTWKVWRVTDKT